jgi:hypothetical protein
MSHYTRRGASSSTAAPTNWQEQRDFMMEAIHTLTETMTAQATQTAQNMQAAQAAQATQVAQAVQAAAQAVAQAAARDPAVNVVSNAGGTSFEKFLKLDPPTFSGKEDPEAAENWIEELERAFDVLSVPEDRKTSFGTYRLKGDAKKWWDTLRRVKFADMDVIPWEVFREEFLDTYFPAYVEEQMQREFLELAQGTMSLVDYTTKFRSLEKYSPNLFKNEKARAAKFVHGLKDGLRTRVLSGRPPTLADAIESATALTKDWERSRNVSQKGGTNGGDASGGKRKDPPIGGKTQGGKRQRTQEGRQQRQQQGKAQSMCRRCNESHPQGFCPMFKGICYRCQQPGHIAPYCPNPPAPQGGQQQQLQQQQGQRKTNGRVYAVTTSKQKDGTVLIEGILLVIDL